MKVYLGSVAGEGTAEYYTIPDGGAVEDEIRLLLRRNATKENVAAQEATVSWYEDFGATRQTEDEKREFATWTHNYSVNGLI